MKLALLLSELTECINFPCKYVRGAKGGERVRRRRMGGSLCYVTALKWTREEKQSRWDRFRHTHTRPSRLPPTPGSAALLAPPHQFPLTYQEQTSLSAEGTPSTSLPHTPRHPLSLSRHCCCEDEMSVLLKVPLKHKE